MASEITWVVLAMLVASAASNTCYRCSKTTYEVDEDKSPTVAALFKGMTSRERADCADSPTTVTECGENAPCALVMYSGKYKLKTKGGAAETGEIKDRVARFCSPLSLSELPAGCYDYSITEETHVGYLHGVLTAALGRPYEGEIKPINIRGQWCQACCEDNSNGWTDIPIE